MDLIAHRGASGYAPENTIAAFKKALEMGMTSFEFDVQMTKDEELVVIHDYSLERTTTGQGFVKDSTLEYIKTVDAGVKFNQTFEGEQVPTLAEVLRIMPKHVRINIELKKLGIETRDLAKQAVKVIREEKREDQVIISSFDHQCLLKVKEYSDLPVGMLLGSNMSRPYDYMNMIGLDCYSINQSIEFISKEFVDKMHENGLKVFTYTVNAPEIAKLFMSFGVDGIFTNYPDILEKES